MASLPKSLENKTFTLAQALSQGLSKYALSLLIEKGSLERVTRGVYRSSHLDTTADPEESYRLATLLCGKDSAICLLSALEHYGITDSIPKKTWVLVPHIKRVTTKNLKLVRCRDPKWNAGIVCHKTYSMTSIERTLIECVIYKRLIGMDVALRAFKVALQKKLTTLAKIYQTAQDLAMTHRIQSVIEVLSA
jgi:predicted transcriptional regulator of viral defense system